MKSKKLWLAAVVIISMLTTGCLSILEGQEPRINRVETATLDIEEILSSAENQVIDTEVLQKVIPTCSSLHGSNRGLPEESVIMEIQREKTKDLDPVEVVIVQEIIHNMHMTFERELLTGNSSSREYGWIERLSDPDSLFWESLERTGLFRYPGDTASFLNTADGNSYIQRLEAAKKTFPSEDSVYEDIAVIQKLIRHAVDNHDILGLWYAHQILHDLDYWMFNYPIYFPLNAAAPPSWRGVETYFGVTKTIEGTHPQPILQIMEDL